MPEQEQCFVCQKHRGLEFVPGGPVYEDALVYAGHAWSVEDRQTPYLGGFIVEPRRHIPTWAELDDEEARAIGVAIRDVGRALKRATAAEHIYVFVLGHNVAHLHVWVVPRYPGTPREFWGLNLFEWPGRPDGTQTAVETICEEIRAALA